MDKNISIDMDKKKELIEEQEVDVIAPEETTEESPEIAITETEVTATPISRSRSWMQEKYPDEEWDDEAYENKLSSHLADTDERLAEYKANDDIIVDLMERNPKFAMVITAMRKGMDFEVALRRYLGDIFKDDVSEDDPNWEELKKASDEFLAEKKRGEEEIATRNKNLEQSDIVLKAFVEKNFATEDEQVAFVEYLRNALRNIGMGEISETFLDMVLKAYTHDNDVEDAKEAGAIEARNEKITAKRIKEKTDTDGMPIGGGSSPIVTEEEPEEDDFLGMAEKRYRNREFK